MVRLKQRYILFDILYPPLDDSSSNFLTYGTSPEETLLNVHHTSGSNVNAKTLVNLIRKVMQDHYGDFGVGTAGMALTIKYFSNKTSRGILRCKREACPIVMATLALITRIGDTPVIVSTVHVSGTIKKCELFSIKDSNNKIALLRRSTVSSEASVAAYVLNLQRERNELQMVSDDEETE